MSQDIEIEEQEKFLKRSELAERWMVGPKRALDRHGFARADLREPFAFVVNEREGHEEASIQRDAGVR